MARAATLLVVAAVATAGCSSQQGAAADPSASASNRVVATPSPTPTPTPSSGAVAPPVAVATHLGRSVPVRLQIAAIGVDSTLLELGLKQDGAMEVPPGGFPAGWYTGAPTPGELGPAIIAGHVDLKGPGVFYDLHTLKSGDRVTITRQDGSRPVFRVTRLQQVPKDRFPTKAVYGNIGHAGLRLITCGGTFNRQSGHYEDNIVVFADLVSPVQ